MSRAITVTGTYKNGVKLTYGIFNPKNAEYHASQLLLSKLLDCFELFKKEVGNKSLSSLIIRHNISHGSSYVVVANHLTIEISFIKDLAPQLAQQMVDINNAMCISSL